MKGLLLVMIISVKSKDHHKSQMGFFFQIPMGLPEKKNPVQSYKQMN